MTQGTPISLWGAQGLGSKVFSLGTRFGLPVRFNVNSSLCLSLPDPETPNPKPQTRQPTPQTRQPQPSIWAQPGTLTATYLTERCKSALIFSVFSEASTANHAAKWSPTPKLQIPKPQTPNTKHQPSTLNPQEFTHQLLKPKPQSPRDPKPEIVNPKSQSLHDISG